MYKHHSNGLRSIYVVTIIFTHKLLKFARFGDITKIKYPIPLLSVTIQKNVFQFLNSINNYKAIITITNYNNQLFKKIVDFTGYILKKIRTTIGGLYLLS